MNITVEKEKQITVKAEENGRYVEVEKTTNIFLGYIVRNGIKKSISRDSFLNFDNIYELRLFVALLANAVRKLEDEL